MYIGMAGNWDVFYPWIGFSKKTMKFITGYVLQKNQQLEIAYIDWNISCLWKNKFQKIKFNGGFLFARYII